MRAIYSVKPGFHVRLDDAQVMGEAIARLTKKLGRPPEPKELADFCRDKREAAHDVLRRKTREIAAGAWEQAAGYFVRAIAIRVVDARGPVRAFHTVAIHQQDDRGEEEVRAIVGRAELRGDRDLLGSKIAGIKAQIVALCRSLHDVAGPLAVRRVLAEIAAEHVTNDSIAEGRVTISMQEAARTVKLDHPEDEA